MKLFYAIVIGLMVLVSACAQQTQPAQTQPTQPEVQPTPEAAEPEEEVEAPAVVVPEEETAAAATGDVRILGKEGFEPTELTVVTGAAVTWINDDEKDLTLTIFKDGRFFVNSDKINPGEIFEQEFTDAGDYEYWSVAYGVKGKVVVE